MSDTPPPTIAAVIAARAAHRIANKLAYEARQEADKQHRAEVMATVEPIVTKWFQRFVAAINADLLCDSWSTSSSQNVVDDIQSIQAPLPPDWEIWLTEAAEAPLKVECFNGSRTFWLVSEKDCEAIVCIFTSQCSDFTAANWNDEMCYMFRNELLRRLEAYYVEFSTHSNACLRLMGYKMAPAPEVQPWVASFRIMVPIAADSDAVEK